MRAHPPAQISMPHHQTVPSPPSKAHPLPPLSPLRKTTLGRYLARRLVQINVTDIFSVPGLGSMMRWRTGWWGLGRSAIGLGVGRQNRSMMRELANELRDEGDEGGRRAREKKKIEEESREKRSRREWENRKCLFNERIERSVIIFFFNFFYLWATVHI